MSKTAFFSSLAAFTIAAYAWGAQPEPKPTFRFDFGTATPKPGFIQVLSSNLYSRESGFGFDLGSKVNSTERGCVSDKPFFYSVSLPEGNYDITATLGGQTNETRATIKAESRRLMIENVRARPSQFTNLTFTVNIRTPKLPGGGQVRLKPREVGPPLVLHWDEKLTLEFNGSPLCLCTLEILKANDALTVYLAGDSTVTDQPREPWNSWGQMLPRFFKPGVAIANHAESGESLPSFLGAKRFDKIMSGMKAGDYLFIQFGHNDQKDKRPNAGPFTTYKTNLLLFIAATRKRGGIPVLVTPMERKIGVTGDTLGDFPAAVRQTSKEENVALIDLNAMSKVFYTALGENLGKAFQDGTHHNNYGSYELAKCVVEGIKTNKLSLAKCLVDDVPRFDPARPDPIESFKVPASPMNTSEKPEGN